MTRHRHFRSRGAERGAVMVETAVAVMVFATLIIGTVEIGYGWRASINVSNATRAGARFGAAAGADSSADFNILTTVAARIAASSKASITKVVIFRADSTTGTVPTNCLTASVLTAGGSSSDACNVYSAADVSAVVSNAATTKSAYFSGTCTGVQWDQYWCPTSRVTSLSSSNGPNYLGVYLEVTQPSVSGVYRSVTIADTTIMRLQPTAGSS